MPYSIDPEQFENNNVDITENDNGETVIRDKDSGESVTIGPGGLSTSSASVSNPPTDPSHVARQAEVSGKADQSAVDANSSDIGDLQSRTEGRMVPLASVDDSDGTTPLDATLTVPDSKAHQSYRLMGWIWGSNYAVGEGGEIDIDYTINGYTTGVYEYTLLDRGTLTWVSDQPSWTDKIWRRYKNPVDWTISADNETVTTDDGNESMFISINNNAHQGFRGMLNGRMGDTWVNGGHPFAEINSVEISSSAVDDLEAKLVLYGIDWKADLT